MRNIIALLISIAMLLPVATVAADTAVIPTGPSFRVETEVFQGGEVQPIARHLILFDSGVIYDFALHDERSVTMFDPTRKRVLLIDRQNRQVAEVPTDELILAMAHARAAIESENKSASLGLEAKPVVIDADKPTSAQKYRIVFGDSSYTTTTQPVGNPQIAQAYNQFVILASQLNVAQKQGGPPFARLALNQLIAEHGRLPLSTDLEVDIRGELKPRRFRSQTNVVEQLSQLDRDRINELGRVLSECKPIPFSEFLQ